jgi:serine/threonine-protein kinase haspin
MLGVSQVYAIIVLPNGGPDLEAYTFREPTKTGWRQACSLFWQIARALATAEDLVSFEVRCSIRQLSPKTLNNLHQ